MITVKNIKNGDIIVRIPGAYLRHHISMCEDLPEGSRVTNTKAFSDAVISELRSETEDGTTPIHMMLDAVVEAAIDNGCDGVALKDWDE